MAETHDEAPRHSRAFRIRRATNWIPLGLTYATFYMGRYNFNVIKGDLATYYGLNKAQVGVIATAGFWTYAASVLVNGPLADKFGGRRAVLVGAVGSMIVNAALCVMFAEGWASSPILPMSILYSLGMYFQSFGAISVVKVNAAWFHVRERGSFGGVFGAMISGGYLLALTLGGAIYGRAKEAFGFTSAAFASVFLAPAIAIGVMFVVDLWRVRDTPRDAGHQDFDTADASSSHAPSDPLAPASQSSEPPVDLAYVFKNVVMHPVIRVIAAAEFCTGFVRQGLLLNFTEFLDRVHHVKVGSTIHSWTGVGITIGGIVGGIVCGILSDRFFQSRRPPVAFIFYLGQIVSLIWLAQARSGAVAGFVIGFGCMWIFGVHGMLSGTASMDFGGKRAAASAAGILDGIAYVASGLTGLPLGALLDRYGWGVWTYALVPFSAIGALLMLRIWNARPQRGGGH